MRCSGRELGWEQIGELSGDLIGDLTGDSLAGFTGEAEVDAAFETRGEQVGEGTLIGLAAVAGVGDWIGAENDGGVGEGLSGLLAAGDTAIFSGFSSSGKKGSGKKRTLGDFPGVTWRNRKVKDSLEKIPSFYLKVELSYQGFRLS